MVILLTTKAGNIITRSNNKSSGITLHLTLTLFVSVFLQPTHSCRNKSSYSKSS